MKHGQNVPKHGEGEERNQTKLRNVDVAAIAESLA